MANMKVGILGGGAAGMIAAVAASRNGAEVYIIERLERVGKKLLATGNGRCNYTNSCIDINRYHSSNIEIVDKILGEFSLEDAVSMFRELGIEPWFDETGKVYPMSLQASSMIDVLREEYLRYGVVEICNERIISINKNGKRYDVETDKNKYIFDKIIIALGGKAAEKLGSDGSGFELTKKIGLEIENFYPALVKLKSDFQYLKSLKGLKINAGVALFNKKGTKIASDFGEVLFADYGISGPPILQLSGIAVEKLMKKENVYLELDMFLELDKRQFYEFLSERFVKLKHKSLKDSFTGLINKRLIIPILKNSGIDDLEQKPTQLNKRQIYNIIDSMKSLKINITGYHSWQEAQVTAGGIKLTNIDAKNMEILKYKGAFLAGEILDVYGDCGGFNLHWSWTTGWKAGKAASQN
jgi:hypothetical protein